MPLLNGFLVSVEGSFSNLFVTGQDFTQPSFCRVHVIVGIIRNPFVPPFEQKGDRRDLLEWDVNYFMLPLDKSFMSSSKQKSQKR
jgi:hypothetical protein